MTRFKNKLLAQRVREKRGDRTLRSLSEELKIGYATLSRIENGKLPDLYNLAELFNWLGDNPADYFQIDERVNDDLAVQLRAAQGMSVESASAFMDIIRAAYAQILKQADEDEKA